MIVSLRAPRNLLREPGHCTHGGDASVVSSALIRHDFSTCVNAYGPAETIRDAIRGCDFSKYPDRYSADARLAAAKAWNRLPEEIICTAGAAELIQAVCAAYLSAGDFVSIVEPAFGEYRRAAELCGAHVVGVQSPLHAVREEWNTFALDIADRIRLTSPKLVFLATPTSPTGFQLSLKMLSLIADACLQTDTLLVIDQSYDAFADESLGTPVLAGHPNVLHVRSITKEHALAGIRVAFGVASREVAESIESVRVPWATSAPAQAAAVATFEADALSFAHGTVRMLKREARRITSELRADGIAVIDSSTHYLLIEVRNAARFQRQIAHANGILVRDCASFGLPACIRIAARTPTENNVLLSAIRSCLNTVDQEFS